MAVNHHTVLATGATGKQGGAVARHMLGRGWNLRVLTRDPDSRAARTLAGIGVEFVRGDLADRGARNRHRAGRDWNRSGQADVAMSRTVTQKWAR